MTIDQTSSTTSSTANSNRTAAKKNSDTPTLAILISGTGSNMQALAAACANGQLAARVVLVASNNPLAKGLAYATAHKIPTAIVDHSLFDDRLAFEKKLVAVIDETAASHVLLAGFMRVLGQEFVERYSGRLINIHPSLLPAYPGLKTHERAIANRDSHAGASVHFVTQQLDGGPVILQAKVKIEDDDTVSSLAQKILRVEHKIYPKAVQAVLNGEAELAGTECLWNGTSRETPCLYKEETGK